MTRPTKPKSTMSDPRAKRVYEYVSLMHVVDGPEWDHDGVYIAYGHRPPREVMHYYSDEKEGVSTRERTALIRLPEPLDEGEINSWINSKPDVLREHLHDIDDYVGIGESDEDADATPEAET